MRRQTSNITGKPTIPVPGRLDLAVLQQLAGNVRERLRQLDAEAAYLRSIADASTSGQSIVNLQRQISQLAAQVSALVIAGIVAGGEPDDNDGQSAALSAQLEELRKIEDHQPVGVSVAEFAELVKRVQGLEEGVLA